MSVMFGQQMEESKTAHYGELNKKSTEIFQCLEGRQHILNC